MTFPITRPRRLRRSAPVRDLVRETVLTTHDFIAPIFVVPGQAAFRREVTSMPGVSQLGGDEVLREVEAFVAAGIRSVIVFGLPETKDLVASGAYAPQGVVQEAVRAIRSRFPELVIVTDVCLCEYTSHGHCGVLDHGNGGAEVELLNDPTLELLAKTAVSHAEAGADIIAPSDMMDGRVAAIRRALDAEGFDTTPIMAYSAKYASGYYGPFRDAADSAPQFGDRSTYQMDPANVREALKEVALDVAEGADIVMVKPALAYMDVIAKVKAATDRPVACYNVSGEYAMVKAAAERGWIDERRVVLETLTGFKRAGADLILTYHALDAARWLNER